MSTQQSSLTEKIKVIACATVIEEMLPLMPDTLDYEILDFGLHLVPENLKASLQTAIDKDCQNYDTIILGYGLCSMAVIGLQARDCTLVVPKVDDCIAIFLGSGQAYNEQAKKEPGTYYLTKGWIEVSDTLLDEYRRVVEKYGEEKADFIMGEMLKHYKRLVYIDTGTENQEKYRSYAKEMADQFKLRFEEMRGSNALVEKMLRGTWDFEFVVAPPGHTITYLDFKETKDCE
jgi:hypothetical protein